MLSVATALDAIGVGDKPQSIGLGDAWLTGRGEELACRSPIDGRELGRLTLATTDQVASVADAAANAFLAWRVVPAPVRGEHVRRFGERIRRHKESLATLVTWEAGKIAQDHGEIIVAEGEICWGGMHSWRENVKLLEMVDMPGTVGYQADMAHSMLFVLGANAEKDRILPADFEWSDKEALDAAYHKVADALRPWTYDFHVAQNDGTTFGSGTHEKTGRHCQVDDPNGRLERDPATGLSAVNALLASMQ